MRFPYPRPERTTDARGRRFYLVDGVPHPSVTTILSATNPRMRALRRRIAPEVMREATALGTLVHAHLEAAVKNIEPPADGGPLAPLASRMAEALADRVLPHLSEVWGSEVMLCMPGAYAGTADLVTLWGGRPTIVDFKTARTPRTIEQVHDYLLQLVAYIEAHDTMFGTRIEGGVVCLITRDLVYQEFRVARTDTEWDRLWTEWRTRVAAFAVAEGWLDVDSLGDAWRGPVAAVVAAMEGAGGSSA